MSFLKNLRNSMKGEIHPTWNNINDISQIKEIINASYDSPQMIFKHSTTCGISASAKHRLESDWNFKGDTLQNWYLDLLSHRPISNQIADTLQVVHQSPQIIILDQGEVIYNASHHAIQVQAIEKALDNRGK